MKKLILLFYSLLISYNLFGAALPTNIQPEKSKAPSYVRELNNIFEQIKDDASCLYMTNIDYDEAKWVYIDEIQKLLNQHESNEINFHTFKERLNMLELKIYLNWKTSVEANGGYEAWMKLPQKLRIQKLMLKHIPTLSLSDLETRNKQRIKEASEQAILEMTSYIQEGIEGQLPTALEDIIREYSMQSRKPKATTPIQKNEEDNENTELGKPSGVSEYQS